jgi:hypothetical protein
MRCEPATLSSHPGAVKARRWRERKRRERAGYAFVTVAVSPGHVRSLRGLGLLAGDPSDWDEPPPRPAALARAVQRLLATAPALADLARVLDEPGPGGEPGEGGDEG